MQMNMKEIICVYYGKGKGHELGLGSGLELGLALGSGSALRSASTYAFYTFEIRIGVSALYLETVSIHDIFK